VTAVERLTVPGNLLVAGEYVVTEPLGLGLAVAVDRRVLAWVESCDRFEIVGRFGRDDESVFSPDDPDDDGLVARAFGFLVDATGVEVSRLRGRIVIDSRSFSADDGTKLGFGSSAAVTVALCAALARLARLAGAANALGASAIPALGEERFAPLAVEAHRAVQHGRGSGYDVLASIHGGIGVVTGGREPSWRSVELPWLRSVGVARAQRPVATTSAITAWQSWKSENGEEHRRIIARSNEVVAAIAASSDFDRASVHLDSARELGERIGRLIGVSASVADRVAETGAAAVDRAAITGGAMGFSGATRSTLATGSYKALGAGNETAGWFSPDGHAPPPFSPVALDFGGARWE
jgi:phosphomevalonate kinase